MSLRRKIALWLCPELGELAAEAEHDASAYKWTASLPRYARAVADVNAIAEAARRAAEEVAWKAEVLEQLKALNATLVKVTEGGNAMRTVCLE